MLNIKELEELGKKAGFSHVALLKSDSIELMPEVREMCKNNICHMYAKRWSCPPGCGLMSFYDPDWYAVITCKIKIKGKEERMNLTLKVQHKLWQHYAKNVQEQI